VVLVHHRALRMFAPGTARGIRATGLMILTALRRISQAIGGGKPSSAEKYDSGD
jgi:hypothetical protein